MRLDPRPHERIDRESKVVFFYDDRPVEAFEGDTIGSALFADGRRIFSRSFKYHRPRGLVCCSGHCPNCMMHVDGVPNVRVCSEPVRSGMRVEPQNVRGSLEHDLLSATDKFGGPFTPVGFYYRTMIHPRRAWPLYEKFLRNVAGLGKVDKHADRERRHDVEHRRAETLVIGGGRAGLAAAHEAAGRGEDVVLVDEGPDHLHRRGDEPFEILAPARAIGIFEGGLVPVDAGRILYRFRTERIVVATGALEQPLVFPGNDLVGIMLPGGVRRLIDLWSLRPGERAVVIGADDRSLSVADDLEKAGTEIAEVVDLRESRVRQISARGKKGLLSAVELDGRPVDCDLLVATGGRQPAYSLLSQAGARVEYDPGRGIFVPTDLPENVEAVGSVTGEIGAAAVPAATYNGAGSNGKCFVCICEDVTDKDMKRAHPRGLRLDRAREALYDRDDGALPGQALPPARHPPLRAGERDGRGDDRDDDRAAALGAGRARRPRRPPARAGQANVDPPPAQGSRRQGDVDRGLAPTPLLRRPAGGGPGRTPLARRHRRLDARQAARTRA